jgi:hypothetical protein
LTAKSRVANAARVEQSTKRVVVVGQIAAAVRIERLDRKLYLALYLKLSLKGCLRLRLLLFLRGIIRFLWLTHNELLFA